MTYQYLTVETKGRVAVVSINRPESRNALCVGLMRELTAAAVEMRDDPVAGVVILTGGLKCFTAGVDLKDPEWQSIFNEPLPVRRRLFEMGPRMCAAWENLPQVTIAAIEGFCIGGGVSLVVACDFRIIAQDAFFRIPEIDLGMNYSWGTLPRLVNLVGPAYAKQWVLLAEQITASEALQSGLAQWSAPHGETVKRALEIAEIIAAKPQAPVSMTKQTVNACVASNKAVAHMDADQFALTLSSEDFQEGVQAFLEKRKPVFNKKLPQK